MGSATACRNRPPPVPPRVSRTPFKRCALERDDVGRLAALRALGHVEADLLTLVQGAVALLLDRGEVDENVDTVSHVNETVSFGGIKPLNLTFGHWIPPRY